ncbi:MAG: hypothetical protein QXO64_06165 [Thermofilaceae archaeon]
MKWYLVAVLALLLLAYAPTAASAPVIQKEALVRINVVWLKVAVQIPSELVATEEYSIPVRLMVTEVDGDLRAFYIKGLRFTIDTSVMEYVPDNPLSLTLGREVTLTVKLAPRFFAAQMVPGDVKDTSLRIDISYYLEATPKGGGGTTIESGYYSVFASIPVRAIAPRTYFYVQPSMNETYEPYLIRFYVNVWVEGEGFVENARAEVSGAPVQCYLLTTGRIRSGERRRLEFIINVSELGPFARRQYNVQLEVTAVTPWGYTYRYVYPLTLTIRPLREVAVSAPSLAAANALTPITVSLKPPPEQNEQVILSVYWGERLIYSGSYSRTIHVTLPEGEETLTVRVESNVYAPSVGKARVRATSVEPRVSAQIVDTVLYFRVAPVYQEGRVDVRVVDESGNTVLVRSTPATSLSYTSTSVSGATTVEGYGSIMLDLSPGRYTVLVTYSTGSASKATSLQYTVPGAQTPLALLPLPLPILVVVAGGVLGVTLAILLLRRRRGGGEEVE